MSVYLKKQQRRTPHTGHERELTFLSFVFLGQGKLTQIGSQYNKCLTGLIKCIGKDSKPVLLKGLKRM